MSAEVPTREHARLICGEGPWESEPSSRLEWVGFMVDRLETREVDWPLGRGPMVSRWGCGVARMWAAMEGRRGLLVRFSGGLAWGPGASDISVCFVFVELVGFCHENVLSALCT